MDVHDDRAVAAPEMRWDGWGDPDLATDLPRAVRALLPILLGRVSRPPVAPAIDEVEVDPSRLTTEDVSALRAVVGEEFVFTDAQTRIRRAGGRSTPDLLRRRARRQRVPDAVIRPADHDEVRAVLQWAGSPASRSSRSAAGRASWAASIRMPAGTAP
ncbi:hypothetical protein [Microbacterium suwonense]|uniref:Uncharacterized protein n=1 Tax=Microbacterium suwonense TaxID=683047 RepID=A0ABN6X2L8_9MICO|nr:hypothetical protein [Microbacterium suwonense]BDZ38207.1 hypothetical protein GCM10025863_08210 [Microbacterium suwonense]